MRNLTTILVLCFLMQSCNSILFTDAQPEGAPVLKEFPENMLGSFMNEDLDTLVVSSTSFIFRDGDPVQLSGDIIPKGCVLKKMDDWYILSVQDEVEWEVFPIEITDNDHFTVHYIDLEENEEKRIVADLEGMMKVQKIYNEEGNFDYYVVSPSKKQFKRLLKKNVFSHSMNFERIK